MFQIRIFNRNDWFDRRSKDYEIAYKAWLDTWRPEYQALDASAAIYSDGFTRQDQVLTIWWQGHCVALTFFNVVNLSMQTGQMDSYFAPWPKEIVERLASLSEETLVCSALTVSRPFQGQSLQSFPIKDLLASASLQHLRMSAYPIMVGNMRNNRNANHLVYKFGAQLLQTVVCNGEPSDLVLFERDRLPAFPKSLQLTLDNAFSNSEQTTKPAIAA
ncbi:MAG: hypothetical protein IPJ84_05805 [Bdellovibrionales bacterium]|nr:hypothetical protein [Bdellovibrionales bacterium]